MKAFMQRLTEKITTGRDMRHPLERHRVALIESWSSIAGNLVLTLLKGTFGFLINSISLMADAAHSASDILSSMVVLIGFSLARRKPDKEHPHGHGRIEYLAGLAIALLLIAAGAVFFYNAYQRVTHKVYANTDLAAIAVVIFSIIVKELMYYFSAALGKLIDSEALIADAWHHRTDSLSSLLVLIGLGGSYLALPALDAWFGFAISLFIAYAGYEIARKSFSRLIGQAPGKALEQEMIKSAGEVEGVMGVHDLIIHDYGAWKVVTMHAEVSGHISLEEAHHIAHAVEEQIGTRFFSDVVVHLDPR